jgi:thiamine-phosphate pyrophosphorylase
MKLIIMTKATFFVEEDKILATLFEEGMESLHLYKPNTEPVYSERLLTLLPEECRSKITVHEHYYLKEEFHLKGIHLDQATTPLPAGYRGVVSRTCRDIATLKEMKKRSNYVFLQVGAMAPAADSTDNSLRPISAEELSQASRSGLIDRHVYALGAQSLDTIRQARDLGFGGIVVGDDLWQRFNIHNQLDFKELLTHFEKLRKAVQ